MPSSVKQKVRNHSAGRIGHFPLKGGGQKGVVHSKWQSESTQKKPKP